MRRRERNVAQQLRSAVDALPTRTKEAMLRGIDSNRIIVGAYVDPESGGICPMLAAHRNGGRTSLASFARAWDAYTGARRPRRATRREVRALRSLIEASLAREHLPAEGSIAELAAQIRAERAELASCARADVTPAPASDDPAQADDLPAPKPRIHIHRKRPPLYADLLTVAEQALADEGSWERVAEPERADR
jgi:hypothetical protein